MTASDYTSYPQKMCTTCKQTFPASDKFFRLVARGLHGVGSQCRTCASEYSKTAYRAMGSYDYSKNEGLYKTCNQCGREYPATAEYWHKTKGGALGLRSDCKSCRCKTVTEYRKNNPEKVRDTLYRSRKKHAAAHKERYRRYAKNNIDKLRAKTRNRGAKRRNAPGSHTADELQEQYQRQKGRCYYCKSKLNNVYHADHVVPISKGGSNYISNIVCACPSCNMSKGSKLVHEWDGTNRLL